MRGLRKVIYGEGRKSGFTLIELLTVIVIIGFLVSLTGVAAIAMRKKARRKKREVQKAALATAAKTYLHEYGFWPDDTITDTDPDPQEINHKRLIDHLKSSMDPTSLGVSDENPRDIHFMRTTDFEIVNDEVLDAVHKTKLKIWVKLSNNSFWCENGDDPNL